MCSVVYAWVLVFQSLFFCFFFFKQKTAYEMRISDWNSDVCSSDLAPSSNGVTVGFAASSQADVDAFHAAGLAAGGVDEGAPGPRDRGVAAGAESRRAGAPLHGAPRSEEHTSELQSLMRNPYAVFCLKKTITIQPHESTLHWSDTDNQEHLP